MRVARLGSSAQWFYHPLARERIIDVVEGLVHLHVLRRLAHDDGQLAFVVYLARRKFDFVAGKSALLAYVTPTPGLKKPTAGYTFSWTGMPGAPPGGIGARIKRYRLERNESDRVEGESWKDFKVIGSTLGAFFATAVA